METVNDSKLIAYLRERSDFYLMIVAFSLVTLVGALDYLTGPELSFSIFYLLPVTFTVWLVGQSAGVLLSIMAAAIWLTSDLLTNPFYSHPLFPYWNAGVRLGVFLIVTFALSSLRAARERQEGLIRFVIHDLRAPISNIISGLDLMKELADDPAEASSMDLLEMVTGSANRMLNLINSLLDLTRLENRQLPLRLETVEVAELVAQSMEQLSLLARQRQVNVKHGVSPDVPAIYVDRELTMRILVNVLGNAIRFSPATSIVTVEVAPTEEKALAFSVTDQGPGIPPEWREKVFNKFIQIQARESGIATGSGLGLTFCKLAVEAQGGRIWLEQQEGRGTTVIFTLPIAIDQS